MSIKLFVGGAANGRRIDTNDRDSIRLRKKSMLPSSRFDFMEPFRTFMAPETIESHHYVMQRFTAEGNRFEVFAPHGQSPSETLQLLIKHYRPNEARA